MAVLKLATLLVDVKTNTYRALADLERVDQKVKTSQRIASTALKGMGIAAAVAVGTSVKSFIDFDSKMTESLAIMEDLTTKQRSKMEATARSVAKSTTISADLAAQSYYYLASAGLDAQQSMKSLPAVAKFAQAGMFDMEVATSLAIDSLTALGLRAKDPERNLKNLVRVTDVLAKGNAIANAEIEQFAQSVTNKAGSATKLLGKDVEELVATLAAFADQGVKGLAAGEKVNILFRDLQKSALNNVDVFDMVGIKVFTASGEFRNIADVMEDLEGAMDGLSDAQKRQLLMDLGFQDRSVAAIQQLIGSSGRIREYEKELRNASGATEEIAQKQLTSFAAKLTIIKHHIMDWAISLGQWLVPALFKAGEWVGKTAEAIADYLAPAADKAREWIGYLGDAFERLLEWLRPVGDFIERNLEPIFHVLAGVGVGALIAAFGALGGVIAGPLIAALGALVGFIASPIAIIGALVGALVYLYNTNEDFKNFVNAAWESVKNGIEAVVNWIQTSFIPWWKSIWPDIQRVVGEVAERISSWFTNTLVPAIKAYVDFVANVVVPAMITYYKKLWEIAQEMWARMKPVFSAIVDFIGNQLIPWVRDKLWPAIQTAFKAISDAIQMTWKHYIQPVFQGVKWTIENVLIPAFKIIWEIVKTVFKMVSAQIRFFYNMVFKPVFNTLAALITDVVIPVIKDIWNVSEPVFRFLWRQIQKVWRIVEPIFKAIVRFVTDKLVPVWGQISDAVAGAFDAIPGLISGPLRIVGNLLSGFLDAVAWIADKIGLDNIAEGLRSAADKVGSWGEGAAAATPTAGQALGADKKGMNRGGPVPGPNVNRDVVPAMLTPGEYVLRKEAVERVGQRRLDMINQGRMGFAEGGAVTAPIPPDLPSGASSFTGADGRLYIIGKDGVARAIKVQDVGLNDVGGVAHDFAEWGVDQLRAMTAKALAAAWPVLPEGDGLAAFVPGGVNHARESILDFIAGKSEEMNQRILAGGGFTTQGGGGPAGTYTPGMLAAKDAIAAQFGVTNVGGYAARNIAGTGTPSAHSLYRAWDFMVGTGNVALGNQISNFLIQHAADYGLKGLIWNAQSNYGGGWKPYGHPGGFTDPTSMHLDHVHAEFFKRGGLVQSLMGATPMRRGGVVFKPTNILAGEGGEPEGIFPLRAFMKPITSGLDGVRQAILHERGGGIRQYGGSARDRYMYDPTVRAGGDTYVVEEVHLHPEDIKDLQNAADFFRNVKQKTRANVGRPKRRDID